LITYDSFQTKAITESEGYSLVIAGAGTGKTSTIIGRLIWLINDNVKPENIFLLTFTNKAANEMITRAQTELGDELDGLIAGTFHHVAAYFLRLFRHHLPKPFFNIIDELDSKRLLTQALRDLEIKASAFDVAKAISIKRNSGSTKEIQGINESSMEKIIEKYNEAKSLSKSYDFDDLLSNFYLLLKNQLEISNQAKFILVDEYQDCNFVQIAILQELSKTHKNLFAVGDDAQSIYSWRSAYPEALQNFEKSFAPCQKFFLLENYRSQPEILKITNEIIKLNSNQYQKDLVTKKEAGLKPVFLYSNENIEESYRVLRELENNPNPNTAVLFRSRYQCSRLERRLLDAKIPYVLRGGIRFFQQLHIKDLVAFVRVVAHLKDFTAWCRILELFEGLGPVRASNFAKLIVQLQSFEEISNLNFPNKSKTKIQSLIQSLKECGDSADIIEKVSRTFYLDYLQEHYPDQERKEDIQPLIEIARQHPDYQDFLSIAALNEEFRGEKSKSEELVLSTVHQAKGLEWSRVIILGVGNGHWPNKKAVSEGRKEEEVRLLYVAATRSRDILLISQVGESTMIEDLKMLLHL